MSTSSSRQCYSSPLTDMDLSDCFLYLHYQMYVVETTYGIFFLSGTHNYTPVKRSVHAQFL